MALGPNLFILYTKSISGLLNLKGFRRDMFLMTWATRKDKLPWVWKEIISALINHNGEFSSLAQKPRFSATRLNWIGIAEFYCFKKRIFFAFDNRLIALYLYSDSQACTILDFSNSLFLTRLNEFFLSFKHRWKPKILLLACCTLLYFSCVFSWKKKNRQRWSRSDSVRALILWLCISFASM